MTRTLRRTDHIQPIGHAETGGRHWVDRLNEAQLRGPAGGDFIAAGDFTPGGGCTAGDGGHKLPV
ncbi:MAG TPA: hypothetical protein VFV73_27680 [Streptosporangiaceae bacterium]|nr:hypothetical protein [Streptosporangiaceae bacterium]